MLSLCLSTAYMVSAQSFLDKDSFDLVLSTIGYPDKIDTLIKEINVHRRLSKEDRTSLTLREIKILEESEKYPVHLANLYVLQAINYDQLNKRHLSAPLIVEAKKLIDEYGDDSRKWNFLRGRVHHNMAYNYYWEQKMEKAIEESEIALGYYKLIKDSTRTGDILSALGVYNSIAGDSKRAIEYYDEAISFLSEHNKNHQTFLLGAQFFKSVDLIILDSLQEAKAILDELIPKMEATKHRNTLTAYSRLADIELKLGNKAAAEKSLKMVIEESFKLNRWNTISTASHSLASLLEEQSRYKEAIEYHKIIRSSIDSLFEQKYNTKNVEAQAQYDALGKQQKIKDLEQAQLLQAARFRTWISTLLALFLFLFGAFGFWYYRQSVRKKQDYLLAEKEKEVQKVRERLLSSITHELRTPLTLVIGQTEALRELTLGKQADEHVESAHRNAQELLAQVDQLLGWNKIEAKAMTLNPGIGNLFAGLRDHFNQIKGSSIAKKMDWQIDLPDQEVMARLDFNKLKTIVNNLLTNAFKYTPESGLIQLSARVVDENQLVIKVIDSGYGIPEEEHPKIFDWYFRAQQQREEAAPGFGVGLAYSKELALLMGGDLFLQPGQGSGSCFELQIPFQHVDTEMAHDAASAPEAVAQNGNGHLNENGNGKGDKPLLLLVEDHVELAQHVVQLLSKHFKVVHVDNAFVGFEMAREKVPDIILTDLMLPNKNGLELCKELKSHMITDHIPVVILTARTEEVAKYKGLQNQADAFLTKPFKSEELILTLNNLVLNRQRLRLRYQMQGNEPSTPQRENPFLDMLMSTVQKNYTDNDFNVDAFAQKMNITRGQLFKKTKALVGLSPSQIIKQHRLEAAKKLLEQGELTVSEAAYSCGFSTPEYFSTVFKDFYKIRPKEVQKK